MASIAAVAGCPNENSTSTGILRMLLNGSMGLSTNDIKYYNLGRFSSIHGCDGCLICKSTGRCALNDEMTSVIESTRSADYIIVSTPVYFYGISAQLKMLIDRLYSFIDTDDRSQMPMGKKAVIIVTCGGHMDEAIDVASRIEKTFMKLGIKTVEILMYSKKDDVDGQSLDAICEKAFEIGKNLKNL